MQATDLWLLNEKGLTVPGTPLHFAASSLWARVGEEVSESAAKEEGNLATKGAHRNWGAVRELGSLGKGSRHSFLDCPKDRTF